MVKKPCWEYGPAYIWKVYIYCMLSYIRHCSVLIFGCNVMAELNRVSWLHVMRGFLEFGKDPYLALFLYYSQTKLREAIWNFSNLLTFFLVKFKWYRCLWNVFCGHCRPSRGNKFDRGLNSWGLKKWFVLKQVFMSFFWKKTTFLKWDVCYRSIETSKHTSYQFLSTKLFTQRV